MGSTPIISTKIKLAEQIVRLFLLVMMGAYVLSHIVSHAHEPIMGTRDPVNLRCHPRINGLRP